MPDDRPRETWPTADRCPRCGATLRTDGRMLWCDATPTAGGTLCLYGIAELVLIVDDPRGAFADEARRMARDGGGAD